VLLGVVVVVTIVIVPVFPGPLGMLGWWDTIALAVTAIIFAKH